MKNLYGNTSIIRKLLYYLDTLVEEPICQYEGYSPQANNLQVDCRDCSDCSDCMSNDCD